MNLKTSTFEIGFWHPFGPHGGETPEEIIKRKRKEIRDNGWTLWSFQFRKTLGLWNEEIRRVNPSQVLVFCSEGKGSKEPKGETKDCNYYVPVGGAVPLKVPAGIKIPHPMGNKMRGSAFIVKDILDPADYDALPIEWLRKDGKWQNMPKPTRPEYLIRPGKGRPMGKFGAVLVLQTPYLAEIRVLSD